MNNTENTNSTNTQNTDTQENTGSNPLSRRVNTIPRHRPSTQEELLSRRKCGDIPDSLFRESKRSGRASDQLQRLRRMIQRHTRFLAEHAHDAITYEVIDGVRTGLTRTLQELNCSDRCGVRTIRRLGQWLSRVRLRLKVMGRSENGADVGRISSNLGIHLNRDEEGRRGVQYGLHRIHLSRSQCTLYTRLLKAVPISYTVRTLMVSTRTREGVLEGRPTSSTLHVHHARVLDDRDPRAPRTYTNPRMVIQVRTLTGPDKAYKRSTTASQLNTGGGDGRTVPRNRRRCSHEG